jgi:RHS repeat-associated protein
MDLPLAVIDVATNTISYVHADHLGRPIRMTNGAKTTVWQATWKPWGEVQTLSGTTTNNLRYPGQYFQIETGLHYNHHRMYDPVTGRYTQPNPLRFVDGPSIYAYAKNSPYMYRDRDGRFAPLLVGAAIGGGVNALAQYWSTGCISLSQVGLAAGAGALGAGWGLVAADAGAGLTGLASLANSVFSNSFGNAAIGAGAAAVSGGVATSGAIWGAIGGAAGPLFGAGAGAAGLKGGLASGVEGVGGAFAGEGGTFSSSGSSGCACGIGGIFSWQ